ncbi:hypothetical protein [Nesterenkonia alkaliphila]|uniref:DUF423 domain-containing protein n=1 Tax=Nesterenkonia alkaliphila TaxID=1463631 RepID=A0A7K1UIH2_9MICC|nr:hypothetical protein [Nesterenkonia alkaliphila]MVT26275.1 hypothetical protein [Nesterenkonia alkaliphila]GFZ97196.1 hypothetical protein GCM10011359_28190 [Nesterenkonia alkaliphila]
MLELSDSAQTTAGVVVLAAITVTTGGFFLTKVARGAVPATDFQRSFYRAGHAHAGVLITLGLVCLLLTEATALTGFAGWIARTGVLISAILMPAGFFLSALGAGRTRPNGFLLLLWAGTGFLVAGLAVLGVGLLAA